jgi:hypothetical protein
MLVLCHCKAPYTYFNVSLRKQHLDERSTPNAQILVLLAAFAALIATLITGQPESQGIVTIEAASTSWGR